MGLNDILDTCRDNVIIADAFTKANQVINDENHSKIYCAISGGSDSDITLDLLSKIDFNHKVNYVWFDTGIEYQATKDHLKYIEEKYNIQIHRERAVKPIPVCCKEYGQPFLNKYTSECIQRLQKFGFQWEDEPYDVLLKKYPNCSSALKWWCDEYPVGEGFPSSMHNINYHRFLKGFLLENPPTFNISNLCCEWAKKKVSHRLISKTKYDLSITGVRKSEGGVRSSIYTSCYNVDKYGIANYRPIFWFKNSDKEVYQERYGIQYSECYTKWGFNRTGCVCCPYGRELEHELRTVEQYEPQMYKAVTTIFKESYGYTRQYREYVRRMKDKEKGRRKLF